jgi:uncharacterized protein (DUF1501 family)
MAQHDLSRRRFLQTGAAALAFAHSPAQAGASAGKNCIFLFLTGGPSQLDTWDPKPAAASDVRGPFKPIATSVPGVQISELFPRMAPLARHYAIIRSMHHTAAPIHETGQQLMQTGGLCRLDEERPHYGAVVSRQHGSKRTGIPAFALLPRTMGGTGVNISHGQGAGMLGEAHAPFVPGMPASADLLHALDVGRERDSVRTCFGNHEFGRSCLQARRLIEAGVRFVTVNMFDTVFDRVSWDCHADCGSLATSFDDYRRNVCPMFDQAYAALLADLHERGLLDSTLVIATGEFGRTPHLNSRGGRNHWPGVWSMLLAGGGTRGGQIVGSSDRLGAEPRDQPMTPADVAALVHQTLGIAAPAITITQLTSDN